MALLPIFCVARFSRTDLSMLVARALKIGQIADGGMPPTYETMLQCIVSHIMVTSFTSSIYSINIQRGASTTESEN